MRAPLVKFGEGIPATESAFVLVKGDLIGAVIFDLLEG